MENKLITKNNMNDNGTHVSIIWLMFKREKCEYKAGNPKEWSSIEPKLIEMAHKLEDNGLIENKD